MFVRFQKARRSIQKPFETSIIPHLRSIFGRKKISIGQFPLQASLASAMDRRFVALKAREGKDKLHSKAFSSGESKRHDALNVLMKIWPVSLSEQSKKLKDAECTTGSSLYSVDGG
jgi:hypothetical protein